jgi:hypothetical protein
MPEYALVVGGCIAVAGDTLDDVDGSTKYTLIAIGPDEIAIEWEDHNSEAVNRVALPINTWPDAKIIDLEKEENNDPNLLFRLRRNS